jgi:hypothetical protein
LNRQSHDWTKRAAILIRIQQNEMMAQMLLKLACAAMMAAQKITTKSWQHR